MKKVLATAVFALIANLALVKAQVNVGSTAAPDASAALQVTSSTRGFRPPLVSLASTTTFGLTTPTVASSANGMIVYDTSASITGSTAYPAYGKGLYTWDGTGWVSQYYTSIVEYLGIGNVSAAYINNQLPPITIDSVIYIQAPDITILNHDTVVFNTAGNYKIELTCEEKPVTNQTINGGLAVYLRNQNNVTITRQYVVVPDISDNDGTQISTGSVTDGSNAGLPFKVAGSTIYNAVAGAHMHIDADSYDFLVSATFQVKSLLITRVY